MARVKSKVRDSRRPRRISATVWLHTLSFSMFCRWKTDTIKTLWSTQRAISSILTTAFCWATRLEKDWNSNRRHLSWLQSVSKYLEELVENTINSIEIWWNSDSWPCKNTPTRLSCLLRWWCSDRRICHVSAMVEQLWPPWKTDCSLRKRWCLKLRLKNTRKTSFYWVKTTGEQTCMTKFNIVVKASFDKIIAPHKLYKLQIQIKIKIMKMNIY